MCRVVFSRYCCCWFFLVLREFLHGPSLFSSWSCYFPLPLPHSLVVVLLSIKKKPKPKPKRKQRKTLKHTIAYEKK
ncbi:MAG: hypothetical protein J3R72DRAFT_51580 [Linnemannia gamsii]|nr:MAG: hypothetical protein J3R72DRAFT_51580 [Linnemannia gamsii]